MMDTEIASMEYIFNGDTYIIKSSEWPYIFNGDRTAASAKYYIINYDACPSSSDHRRSLLPFSNLPGWPEARDSPYNPSNHLTTNKNLSE